MVTLGELGSLVNVLEFIEERYSSWLDCLTVVWPKSKIQSPFVLEQALVAAWCFHLYNENQLMELWRWNNRCREMVTNKESSNPCFRKQLFRCIWVTVILTYCIWEWVMTGCFGPIWILLISPITFLADIPLYILYVILEVISYLVNIYSFAVKGMLRFCFQAVLIMLFGLVSGS